MFVNDDGTRQSITNRAHFYNFHPEQYLNESLRPRALILFASLRERLELSRIPKAFRGTSIALITAGILALAFMGFSGLVK